MHTYCKIPDIDGNNLSGFSKRKMIKFGICLGWGDGEKYFSDWVRREEIKVLVIWFQ